MYRTDSAQVHIDKMLTFQLDLPNELFIDVENVYLAVEQMVLPWAVMKRLNIELTGYIMTKQCKNVSAHGITNNSEHNSFIICNALMHH